LAREIKPVSILRVGKFKRQRRNLYKCVVASRILISRSPCLRSVSSNPPPLGIKKISRKWDENRVSKEKSTKFTLVPS